MDPQPTFPASTLLRFTREVRQFSGREGLATVAVMALAVVTEGIGILLLIPLLAMVGLSPSGPFPDWLQGLFKGVAGPDSLYVVLAVFLALVTLRQLLLLLQVERVSRLRFRFVNHVRRQLLEALLRVRWRYLSRGMLYRQAQILTLDVNRIGEGCELQFRLAAGLLFLAVQISIAAMLSPGFTAVALGTMLAAHFLLRNRLTQAARRGEALSRRNDALYSLLGNLKLMLRIARMTGASTRLLDNFERETNALAVQAADYVRHHEWDRIMVHLTGAGVLCLALIVGLKVLDLGAVEILLLIVIFARLVPQLSSMQQMLHRLFHAMSAYEHAYRSVETLHEQRELAVESGVPIRPALAIALRDIEAGYEDDGGEQVLKGASLSISVGEVVALTGESGCGKSTLADILAGLLEPGRGQLIIDGIPLDPGQLARWRQAVGYVEQEAALFTGTLTENLTFGAGPTGSEQIERALEASRAREFIDQFPARLGTHVGENGSRLSGGQRQRIALARELLREPRLLVLDEATSGLDAETESRVFAGLRQHYPELMVLVITHRASSLSTADRVLVLSDGRVNESPGAHVAQQPFAAPADVAGALSPMIVR
jgi:ATP-binding cassette subfamily C protein